MERFTTWRKSHLLHLLLDEAKFLLMSLPLRLQSTSEQVGLLSRLLQLGGDRLLASRLLADASRMHVAHLPYDIRLQGDEGKRGAD